MFVVYSNSAVFHNFFVRVDNYVDITAQTNMKVLKYLNTWIIQLDMGVSFDQTHNIQTTILDKWFPKGSTEQIIAADTQYWTDSDVERDIELQFPAMNSEQT